MLRKKDGFASIAAMIVIFTVMPLLLFAVVDVPFWMTANRRLQSIVDNAASGASTALYEPALAEGVIEFDEPKVESILFSQIGDFFELVTFASVGTEPYKQLPRLEDSRSYFQKDPIIIRHQAGVIVDVKDVPPGTPIIEYIIFNPKDHFTSATYHLVNGQEIVLYKPTVVLSITTRVHAPVMLFYIDMHKIAIREVSMGQYQ